MRRWFRRKGKDTGQDEENGPAPLVEETEPGSEAVSGPEVTGEEALAESEPEAPEAAPAQTETDTVPRAPRFSPPLAPGSAAGGRGPTGVRGGRGRVRGGCR